MIWILALLGIVIFVSVAAYSFLSVYMEPDDLEEFYRGSGL